METDQPILYFSRGRGHGHAVPDAALIRSLRAKHPALEIVVASYATGARTFADLGIEAVDLGLPEENEFLATLDTAADLIERCRPCLVIAHEEFAVLPAAARLAIPAVLVSDWLPTPGTVKAEACRHAAVILVKEFPGFFPEPPGLQTPPRYTGPVCRRSAYSRNQRLELRKQLDLGCEGPVITVISGGWSTEGRAPLADMVLEAFRAVAGNHKRLVWVSQRDYAQMAARLARFPGSRAFRFITPIERLIAASDVVVTKATRCTLMDIARLGVPSISISHGLNPVDEIYCPRIPGNIALLAKATTPEVLTFYLSHCLEEPERAPLRRAIDDEAFAEILLAEISRLLSKTNAVGLVR